MNNTFIKLLLILLFFIACGTSNPIDSNLVDQAKLDKLNTKLELYKNLEQYQTDTDGFVQHDECDSLLFSGLIGIATDVNLLSARDDSGKWHRRSLQHPECYKGIGSTISRDQLMGVMWWSWRNKRLDVVKDLFSYGESHDWIMGDGDPSRTYFTPNMQSTLAELMRHLGGKDRPLYRNIPKIYSKNIGFLAHLDMLHILLRSELVGNITDSERNIVTYNYQRVPDNALYSFIYHKFKDGNQTETVDALLNEQIFPNDRLPTSKDRCEPWIYQRDLGSSWEPCDDNKTHSGGDFIFVATLLGL